MNNNQELIIWLRKMGFTGEIPDSFVEICNNSTSFIWEELMQNVVPKKEAEKIRKNIILHRLKQKDLDRQDEFVYKMKNVEIFRKKLALENKLHLLSNTVQEKQLKFQKLSQNSKVKELTIDFLKKKINQNKQRKYLLDLKRDHLEKQNSEAEEMLTKLKNVTPVEVELSSSTEEITETLEKCSEKLTQIIKENLKSKQNRVQGMTVNTMSKKKKPADMSSIASYMAIREKEDFAKISINLAKKFQHKENMSPNISQGRPKQNTFRAPQTLLEVPKLHTVKRESLGILHDSFIENDSFSDISKTFLSSNKPNDNSRDDVFTNIQDDSDINESIVFNYNHKSDKKEEKNLNKPNNENYNDDTVNLELRNILQLNNRQLVYNVLQKIIDEIKLKFTMMVSIPSNSKENKRRANEDDIAKLQSIHIQTALKILQQKGILNNLLNKITKKKAQISEITGQGNEEYLDLAIKQVKIDASLAAMKKAINPAKLNDNNELEIIQSKIFKIKNEIAGKIGLIQFAIEELNKVNAALLTTKEKTLSPLWHLHLLKAETKWMEPMLENRWTTEMKMFEKFPLEYQRQCTFTDKKTFYREICTDNYSEIDKMNQEDLQMLCEILESPFSPPETVLVNLIRANEKIKQLKGFKKDSNVIHTKTYSYEELQKQESYLSYAIDSLKTIICSSKASRTLAVGQFVEQSMKIWLEMPMKDFISSKVLVNDQTYQCYEKKLKSLL